MPKFLTRTVLTLTLIFFSVAQAYSHEASLEVGGHDYGLYDYLRDVSVTIKAEPGSGSGTLITRAVRLNPESTETVNVTFVWTAAHVVAGLRKETKVIVAEEETSVVTWADAIVMKDVIDHGRKVGEINVNAQVIRYSEASTAHDLALLMIRQHDYSDVNVTFYKDKVNPVRPGTELYHMGSLLGVVGSGSLTRGIISYAGRVDANNGLVFDQTSVPAYPGSSGGGMFFTERSGSLKGQYVGMLVRGHQPTFNLIVPVRRMWAFAKKYDLLWAMDHELELPDLQTIVSGKIELNK